MGDNYQNGLTRDYLKHIESRSVCKFITLMIFNNKLKKQA